MNVVHSIGRRKSSVARIYLKEGSGNITVNQKDYKAYFCSQIYYQNVEKPFVVTSTEKTYDVRVTVKGGGLTGQSESVSLAISRALVEIDPDHRILLKPEKLLRRDSRVVERKKYGQKKARKKFQFSKR